MAATHGTGSVNENVRVLEATALLRKRALAELGPLLNASTPHSATTSRSPPRSWTPPSSPRWPPGRPARA